MSSKAILLVQPNAQFTIIGGELQWELHEDSNTYVATNLEWYSPELPIPSKEQIEQAIIQVKAQEEANKHQYLRFKEYPPLADLADAIYWQSEGDSTKMTAYLAAVDAVKLKYPKG
jgi:hypothetical protein